MDPLYDVCFAGETLEGQDLQAVRLKLGKLFNADDAILDKLFSGKTQILKRGCDRNTALKYKKAIEQAGAKPIIRSQSATENSSAAAAQSSAGVAAEAAVAPSGDENNFNLAPAGADMLRAEERSRQEMPDIDISNIALMETGADLSDGSTEPPPAPDTSHLSMGEVGEDIPNLPDTRTAIAPNTNDISLAPEGGDFSDCAPLDALAPQLDLSAIELAPVGVDVLDEQYRKKGVETSAPDTSHLSLDP
jgi:hypothetical protein